MSNVKPHQVSWSTPLPRLTIEFVRSWEPRNCLHKALFRVTSSPFPLTDEQIAGLDRLGLLGSGQSYRVVDRKASKIATGARGYDTAGHFVDANPLREDGEPYPPREFDVYTYEVERTCDSGD